MEASPLWRVYFLTMGFRGKRGAADGEEPREGTTSAPRPLADRWGREARPHVETRLDRQAGRWVLLSLLAVILVTPAWMLLDELGCFALLGDDFAYIAYSRQWPITWRNLLTPHNTHIVPIFRIWTFGLVALAGHLENLPTVFAAASYLGLVMAMLAVGGLTALETRRPALGLTAMAILGISTVTHPLVTWYSAGQALWAGTGAVATILLAREWSLKGGRWRLGLVALGALAAPAIWTGGLVAGPAAIAYLRAKDRSRSRTPAAILAAVTISWILFLLLLILAHRQISEPTIIWEQHSELWPRPIQAVLHTAQAIIEALVLGNLGLDAITTPAQALALTLDLIALWALSRRGRGRANPLETSGVTMLPFGSFLLIYTFRGNLPYSSLRTSARLVPRDRPGRGDPVRGRLVVCVEPGRRGPIDPPASPGCAGLGARTLPAPRPAHRARPPGGSPAHDLVRGPQVPQHGAPATAGPPLHDRATRPASQGPGPA